MKFKKDSEANEIVISSEPNSTIKKTSSRKVEFNHIIESILKTEFKVINHSIENEINLVHHVEDSHLNCSC